MNNNRVFLIMLLILFGTGAGMAKAQGNKDNPFGVLEFLHWNHDWNNFQYPDRKTLEKAIFLMKEAGVGWVRVDFSWQDIEPCRAASIIPSTTLWLIFRADKQHIGRLQNLCSQRNTQQTIHYHPQWLATGIKVPRGQLRIVSQHRADTGQDRA